MISLIVCVAQENVIGKNNTLPWHLPNDLQYFKEKTMGKKVVMGRKTYESIGKPLPHRENIVMTRDKSWQVPGVSVIDRLDAVLPEWEKATEEVMIVGGAEIYRQLLPHAQKVYLTKVDYELEGDAFFPVLGDEWEKTAETPGKTDEKNKYEHVFYVYEKKQTK